MSDNKEFIEFYNQTRGNHVKMHTWGLAEDQRSELD